MGRAGGGSYATTAGVYTRRGGSPSCWKACPWMRGSIWRAVVFAAATDTSQFCRSFAPARLRTHLDYIA